jgi:HAD superfamily hydrolase (TIGR01549 family)
VDGERFCAAAGLPWDERVFERAEAAGVAAVQRLVLERPRSTDAERLPLFLEAILEDLGIPPDVRRAASARIAAEHRRSNLWSQACADAAATLEALARRGYRMGVVSNADGRVRGLLERAGLSPFLEIVVDSSEVGFEKPDPRIFQAATAHLDLPPSACAYIGDIYEIDVLGARRAGLRAVLIGTGAAPEGVERVRELPELLGLFP